MFNTFAAIAVLVIGGYFIVKRTDVRLVLAVSAAILFALAGKFPDLFKMIAKEMANPGTVIPICSSVGFAYILNLTECDKQLVCLLLHPLRKPFARALLLPGGIAVCYIVNMAVVSQTAVAAVVGPILLPLLRDRGIKATTAGAALLLGSSMGGELFNPGASEVRTLQNLTKISAQTLTSRIAPFNLAACGLALLVFWYLSVVAERSSKETEPLTTSDTSASRQAELARLQPIKALIPLIPLLLLALASPLHLNVRLHLDSTNDYIAVLFAMLVGVVAAGLTAPPTVKDFSAKFFSGAGYAYTHIISLIITGTIFVEGIKANGLIERMVEILAGKPIATLLAGMGIPWLLAAVSGSGIAPANAMLNVFIPQCAKLRIDPMLLGPLVALTAQFGRTLSPAAAVAALCADLTAQEYPEQNPSVLDLVKRVARPLLAGGLVLFLIALFSLLRS